MDFEIFKFVIDSAGNQVWQLEHMFSGSIEEAAQHIADLRTGDSASRRAEYKSDSGVSLLECN